MKIKFKSLLLRIFLVGLVAAIGLLGWIKFKYGNGRAYHDMGADNPEAAKRLEKFIRLDYPPGNIAVATNGHVYFNYHPIAKINRFEAATVFEWADGKIAPFPSIEMQKEFQGTFGMTIDSQNRIWFIEPAAFDFPHTRLRAFDLQTKRQVEFFEFPGHAAQFAEDLRVTADGNFVLLANPGIFRFTDSELVIYSVKDHTFRTVLTGHPLLQPEDWLMQTRFGSYRMVWGLVNFAVGVDGIEISLDQKWVYLAAMTSSRLCRVPLSALLDAHLSAAELSKTVEDVGQKPLCDGIAMDKAGRVIITDVEHGGIMAFDSASKKISTLVRSPEVIWPDGIVTGPDNSIYFTDSAIPAYITQLAGPPDKARLRARQSYYIYRFQPQTTLNQTINSQ